jgi:hypothetical protein
VLAVQTCGGQELRCHSFLTAALDCGQWPAAAPKTIKVKVTLEQATKAQGGSKGIALLFL